MNDVNTRGRRAWRLAGLLPGAALMLACDTASERSATRPLSIRASVADTASGVDLVGVDRATLQRLAGRSPNDSTWRALLVVYVEGPTADARVDPEQAGARTPPVIGRYTVIGDRVHFVPRFAFTPGVSYRVEADTAQLHRLATGDRAAGKARSPLVYPFAVPAIAHARTTRVLAVHPSADRLPSNLLRWYIEFSAPMEPGSALEHVRLVDETGREVRGAFLALDQELWDPERRRLTLLFDPGRVKRGVRTNIEMGAPLVAGRRYRLVIDRDWADGTGAALMSGFEHAFEAAAADRESLDPQRWRLTIPPAATRAPLEVAFGEPLDHALARHMVEVHDASGRRVPGSVTLVANDSVWRFVPERGWMAGEYTLHVDSSLEDVAGNTIAHAFDVDMAMADADTARAPKHAMGILPFRIR